VLTVCRRKKKWEGPLQYEDKSGQLMMTPADMALLWDRKFKKYVDLYAKDEEAFFKVRHRLSKLVKWHSWLLLALLEERVVV
jgi:catalase (peroxidase I)